MTPDRTPISISIDPSGVGIEFLALPEIIIPVFQTPTTKRVNILTFDLVPTRLQTVDTHGVKHLLATDWVVRQQSVVPPLAQALEAHVRHHAGQALVEYAKYWSGSWDYSGQYAVEIVLGRLPVGAHDVDNLGKTLMDGLQGAGGLFSSDAKVEVVRIERGGSERRGYRDAHHGDIVPTIIRVFPTAAYHAFSQPDNQYVAGVVFPSRWADYSLAKERGLPIFQSEMQVRKKVAKAIEKPRKA